MREYFPHKDSEYFFSLRDCVQGFFSFFFFSGNGEEDSFPLASFSSAVSSVFEITRLGKIEQIN